MTAEEIRKENSIHGRDDWFWLKEIAAQLAELNHRLSPAGQAEAEKLAAQIRGRSTQAHDRG